MSTKKRRQASSGTNAPAHRGVEVQDKEEQGAKGEARVTKHMKLSWERLLLFLLEFLAVSALLLALWFYLGTYYQLAVFFVAHQILLLLGYSPAQIAAVKLTDAYLVNFNLVPLVALSIVTPNLIRRRRVELLAFGLPILFLLHVLDTVAHLPYFFELLMQRPGFATLVVNSLGVVGVAAPFIIWFVLCRGAIFGK
jgi:hypothetical protein